MIKRGESGQDESTKTTRRRRPAMPLSATADMAPPGLRGVVVTGTELGDVRGEEARYHYRQYDAVELAERRSFEDVWYLLLHGRLPTDAESAAFAAEIRRLRVLPEGVEDQLPAIAADGGPLLDQLRSALSLAGAVRGCRPMLD